MNEPFAKPLEFERIEPVLVPLTKPLAGVIGAITPSKDNVKLSSLGRKFSASKLTRICRISIIADSKVRWPPLDIRVPVIAFLRV